MTTAQNGFKPAPVRSIRRRGLALVMVVLPLLGATARAQTAPLIVTPPSSQTEIAGNNVLLAVSASGTAPLTYTWSFNDQPLVGATASSLLLATVAATHAGSYRVTVTNAAGSTTSAPATLTVLPGGTSRGLDPGFILTTPSEDSPKLLVEQPDGKLLVVANFTYLTNSFVQTGIARLNRDGSLDPTFQPGSELNSTSVTSLRLQGDGRILVAGTFATIRGVARPGLARLNSDGSLDATFAPEAAAFPGGASLLGLLADGNIVVSAAGGLFRLRPDGTFDLPAPLPIMGDALALGADGKISAASIVRYLIPGSPGTKYGTFISVVRYNPDGTPDPTFGPVEIAADRISPATNLSFPAFRVLDDGRLILAYNFENDVLGRGWVAVRLNADGTIDPGYNLVVNKRDTMHGAVGPVIAISGDGQLTTARTEWNLGYCYVTRYDPSGRPNFAYEFYRDYHLGRQSFSALLALQSGDIVAAGALIPPEGPLTNVQSLVRLTTFQPHPPVIVALPAPVTVNAGESASPRLAVTGTGPFEVRINGGAATTNDSGFIDLPTSDAQQDTLYSVTIANAAGSVTSPPIVVHVTPSAPVFTAQPEDAAIIFAYTPAATVTFAATARGTAPLTYQWSFNGAPLADATSPSLTVTPTAATAGTYALTATNAVGQTTSRAARLTVEPGSRIINVAARGVAGAGENLLVAGFVIAGDAPKSLLIRAAGPALKKFAVGNALADPQLVVYDAAGAVVAENDDWGSGVADSAAFDRVGAFRFATGSGDAALIAALPPGNYTATVTNRSGTTGIALLEVYEADASAPRLINLSSRQLVGAGEQVAVPGVVVRGAAPKKLLIRAVGPTLRAFHVHAPLADPTLALVGPDGTTLATNDDWSAATDAPAIAAAAASSGAFALPAGSKDAAMLVSLPPGNYTALATDATHASGVVLVEIYEVP